MLRTDKKKLFWAACGVLGFAVTSLAFNAGPAYGDDAAAFYKGKTVKMTIGYPPGSGYDVHARAVMHHIHRHIPGNPTVISQNMPGAGSLKAANYLYNVAEKDGTVLGAINRSLSMQPLLETDPQKKAKLKFDPLKFNWIGSVDKVVALGICREDSGLKNFDQFFQREVIQTASSPTSDSTVFPTVFNKLLGTKIKIIGGHQGSRGNYLALERGEAECYLGTSYGSVRTIKPQWLKPEDKFINVVVVIGTQKPAALKDVPLVLDYAKTNEQKKALELLLAPQVMGRPHLTTPGVPADRVKALREAYMATMKDPKFKAEAQKTGIEIEPLGGEAIETFLEGLYESPPGVVEMLQKAMPKRG